MNQISLAIQEGDVAAVPKPYDPFVNGAQPLVDDLSGFGMDSFVGPGLDDQCRGGDTGKSVPGRGHQVEEVADRAYR